MSRALHALACAAAFVVCFIASSIVSGLIHDALTLATP